MKKVRAEIFMGKLGLIKCRRMERRNQGVLKGCGKGFFATEGTD
jgi:hypothetical protein